MLLFEHKSQDLHKLLLESDNRINFITQYFKEMSQKGAEYLKEKEVDLGMDFSFLFTFGVAIPPLIKIFTDFYNAQFPELNSDDVTRLTIAIIVQTFLESRKDFEELGVMIKERELDKEFEAGLNFADRVSNKISRFLVRLGVGVKNFTNIVKFAALIPILDIILDMVNNRTIDFKQLITIVGAIATWYTIDGTGDLLKKLFGDKLSRRFSVKK